MKTDRGRGHHSLNEPVTSAFEVRLKPQPEFLFATMSDDAKRFDARPDFTSVGSIR